MMLQLKDVTDGERLLLERRRHQESQRDAAARHGVSRYRYRRWEADSEDGAPRVPLQRLREYEACFLLRRRTGTPLHELAAAAGVSRWWLCQMEYGQAPAARLVRFWGATLAGENGRSRARQAR
jgi:DNA-binding XRE family transcriptional regulator